MQQARREWRQQQASWDGARLVFLDETWTSTCMTPARGRAPRGQRCFASIPHGHWKTTAFIAALRCDALTAPMVIDGAIDGAAFLAYVRAFLCPTLRSGDIVIADNLSGHQVAGVREAIEATGATLRYLPPLFARSEPDRKALRQAQGPTASGRSSNGRCPLAPDRHRARCLLRRRVQQLLQVLRICQHLNRNCSSVLIH